VAALEVAEVAYREVMMLEVREILRQWLAGTPRKRVAARLSCDPKTVRRYVRAAGRLGMVAGQADRSLCDQVVAAVIAAACPERPAIRGQGWAYCQTQREFIEAKLAAGVRLSKIRRLLIRSGVAIPYATLRRFAISELEYGRRGTVTMPVVDGEPGSEVQLDTGWVIVLEPDEHGRRRKMKAWIFTPAVSRYRFVYPIEHETTQSGIEACEAAWEFYGGIFTVIIPDNTSAIIEIADPLGATINTAFLEYSQMRGFVIDPARVRRAKDKGRVERSVRDVRDDCYAGETIRDLHQARERGVVWATAEYGMRRHTTTGRMPREHFLAAEQPCLLAAPESPYDIPIWCDPKVPRDHLASVARSLYSLPTEYIGQRLRARADSQTVRFYGRGGKVVKIHGRVGPGQKSIDAADFPRERSVYAMRDIDFLRNQAVEHDPVVGQYASRLLDSPLPWTRMRQVRALLSLVRKYGAPAVAQACSSALTYDMIDVRRLKRMLEQPKAKEAAAASPRATVIPIARYLRDPAQYSLPLTGRRTHNATKKEES
jgi:hypothetical protein